MKSIEEAIRFEQKEYERCLNMESNIRKKMKSSVALSNAVEYHKKALNHKYYVELFMELQAYREKFGTKFANRVYELEENECMCIYCNRVFNKKEKRMFTKKDNPKLCICFDCY